MSMETHDIGSFFWYVLPEIRPRRWKQRRPGGHKPGKHKKVRGEAMYASVAVSWEMEGTYRRSLSLVLRLPGNRALVLGRWSRPAGDVDSQYARMGLRGIEGSEI